MTRVKICGITNLDDARAAVDYGADALGFILVAESPRCVGTEVATRLSRAAPPFVARAAVCRRRADLPQLASAAFTACQYYEEGPAGPADVGAGAGPLRWVRAYRVRGEETLTEVANTFERVDALLLDAYHPATLGGSGITFDWDLAREVARRFARPLILAGGLTPENVGDAIAAVRPYAVDVASGVEAEPGRKDHAKLRALIRAVRKADRALDGD